MGYYIKQRLEIIKLKSELKLYKEQQDILLGMILKMAPASVFVEGVLSIGEKRTRRNHD